jgi:hypothetical protein
MLSFADASLRWAAHQLKTRVSGRLNLDLFARGQLVLSRALHHSDVAELGFQGLALRFRVPNGRHLVIPTVLLEDQANYRTPIQY